MKRFSLQDSTKIGQSETVYAWENNAFKTTWKPQMSLVECERFVDRTWLFYRLADRYPRPLIKDGRGHDCARADSANNTIHLPRWARNDSVILHEVAHLLIDRHDEADSQAHGGIFMMAFLRMVADLTLYSHKKLVRSARAAGIVVAKNHPIMRTLTPTGAAVRISPSEPRPVSVS